MAHESFSVSEVIPATPDLIYSAWLDTTAHSAFTGDEASVEPFVGGRHSSFGGYAEGTTLELSPGRRIVQTWRSKDFPDGTPDSRLEVTLEETLGGTMVTIQHTEIPSGQGERYREGWVKFYLQALKQYFAGQGVSDDEGEAAAGDDDVTTETAAAPAPRKASSNGASKPHRAAMAKKKPTAAKAAAAPRKATKAKARKPAAKKVAAVAHKRPAAKTARAKGKMGAKMAPKKAPKKAAKKKAAPKRGRKRK